MKQFITRIIIALALITGLLVPATEVCADFEDIGVGARPIAMGNAFVGLADDANSIYYNPAGLGLLTRKELTGTYGRLFMGLTDGSSISNGFIGYVHPLDRKIGTFGVGWLNLSLTDSNALINGKEEESITRYAENAFIISYGRDITDIASESLKRLFKGKGKLPGSMSVGLNMKFMMKSFGLDDYSMEVPDKDTIDPVFGDENNIRSMKVFTSYDVGLFYRLDNFRTSFGLALTDINNPYTALQTEDEQHPDIEPEMDFRRLPAGLRIGAAYREPLMNIVFDMKLKAGDVDLHMGIERWFHGRNMALRAGFNHGSRGLNNITVGACYKHAERYQFDYVFLYPLSGFKNMYGSHRISFTVRFGEITEEREIRSQAERITKGIKRAKREKLEKMKRLDQLRNKFLRGVKR